MLRAGSFELLVTINLLLYSHSLYILFVLINPLVHL